MYNKDMKDLWQYLKESKKPILLYGMGDGADKIISVLNRYGIKISGVFASDGFVRQKRFHGFEVTDYKTAKSRFGDMIVLLCFGTPLEAVIENIRLIAAEQELYAPDVAVYGGVLFNLEYVRENRERLEAVYGLLADDLSKKTFENIIYYKLSGKIEYLFDCESIPDEPYQSFFMLDDEESFLDLGAYRGDTVLEFVKRVNEYQKIVAVEPDLKTYKKLCSATEKLDSVITVNACIADSCGQRKFNMDSSRGSSTMGGGVEIEAKTIDSLEIYIAPTIIKMDIEGEELGAIKGAQGVIRKYRPKMNIACYHRSDDLINIPEAVLKINSNYKIYMRHFPCLPAWDTAYFFV